MRRTSLDDLTAFATVARTGSFTRAAALLGTSQPALSHTIRTLEEKLGVRLLARTTRHVAPTDAGDQLLRDLRPALHNIDAALRALQDKTGELGGTLRITADRHGYDDIMAKALPSFLAKFPNVGVEISLDDSFVDVVGAGFDAGLRLGGLVQKDMVAVRVGPNVEVAIVAAPSYWDRCDALPVLPQDLARHRCVNYRIPRTGGLYAWAFEKKGRRLSVRVDGGPIFNDGAAILRAALDGVGVAYLFRGQLDDHLASGRLLRVLADWCPPQPGFHLYHSGRRQSPPALQALVRHLCGQTPQAR